MCLVLGRTLGCGRKDWMTDNKLSMATLVSFELSKKEKTRTYVIFGDEVMQEITCSQEGNFRILKEGNI